MVMNISISTNTPRYWHFKKKW